MVNQTLEAFTAALLRRRKIKLNIIRWQVQNIVLGKNIELGATALVTIGVGNIVGSYDRVVKTHIGIFQTDYRTAKLGAVIPTGGIKSGASLKEYPFVEQVGKERIEVKRERIPSKAPGVSGVTPKSWTLSCKRR